MSDSGYAPSERCDNPYWIQVEDHMNVDEELSKQSQHCYANRCRVISENILKMATSNHGKQSSSRMPNCFNGAFENSHSGIKTSTGPWYVQDSKHGGNTSFKSGIPAVDSGSVCSGSHQRTVQVLDTAADLECNQNRLPFGFGGWSPVRVHSDTKEVTKAKDHEEIRRKAQIKAYINWMNSQLRKKPGTRIIEDLKCDMQDGVALIDLVSIIAGQTLEDTYRVPANNTEKLANIQQVINFMMGHKIKMHQISAKDILDGNLKSIMRLILALAAHYKPNSVKQSSRGTPTKGITSMVGIAQSASVTLADARHDMSIAGHKPQKPPHVGRLESTGSPHGATPRRLEFGALTKSQSQDFNPGCHGNRSIDDSSLVLSMLDEEHSLMEDDIQQTKCRLLQLQQVLLSGQAPEDTDMSSSDKAHDMSLPEPSNSSEEVALLRSRLQQTEDVLQDVRQQLSKARTECMQLQGIKQGLQQRLSEQEKSVDVLKAELLRAGFCQQSLENTKSELEQKLVERDKLVSELRRDLSLREQQLDKYHAEYHCQQQDRDNSTHNIKAQIIDLHDKIKRVGETESNLSSKMISQDRKLLKLETKILQGHGGFDFSTHQTSSHSLQSPCSDDFQLVRESLQSLRNRFPGDDPQHQTIDTLEQSISSLMERLNVTEQDSRWSDTSSLHNPSMLSASDNQKSMLTSHTGLPFHRLGGSSNNGHVSTKLLYFTDRTVTPFMCNIPKRLGEVTLRDIKEILDRPGNYRYHFKAMDPEFGTVKEEITHDDDIVPGWEGKIVAWIEEDPA